MLEVSLRARAASSWAPAGHEVAWAQFVLPAHPGQQQGLDDQAVPKAGGFVIGAKQPDLAVNVEREPEGMVVSAAGSKARFAGGWLVSWTAGGAEMLDRAPRLELWRAPTDNDRRGLWVGAVADEWARAGLHRLQHRVDTVKRRSRDGLFEVAVSTRVAPAAQAWCVKCTYRYLFDTRGRLAVVVEGYPEGDAPGTFARVGLAMALVPALREVTWYGLGPQETYPDSMESGRLGRYRASVEELETPYVVPQENGNRSEVRWCQISDGMRGILVAGQALFGFSVHPWSTGALAAARHRDELEAEPVTWLHLDHRQQGLGSATCGPGPLERYVLRSEPFRFTFGFRPLSSLALDPGPAAVDLLELLGPAGEPPLVPDGARPGPRQAR